MQALVLSLFLTLFARLWYMQVLTGDGYRAQAAEQSVRDVVVQPARGLIVDDMGRPLVANRSSWVVSIDRTLLGKLPDDERATTLRKLSRVVHVPVAKVEARMLLCGQPGSKSGICWNGSPYQPVPVARDVPQKIAVKVLEKSEDYPAVLAQQESVRAYPSPYGVNAAHLLGYLSPITEGELDEAEKRRTTPRSTAPRSWVAPASRRGTTPGCVDNPATRRWPSTPWAGCSVTLVRSCRRPGTLWSPPSTPRCRPSWRSSCTRRSRRPAPPPTP